jgi:hypothetical protein
MGNRDWSGRFSAKRSPCEEIVIGWIVIAQKVNSAKASVLCSSGSAAVAL